jgi:8-oxo-dGTP diphosphatase
MKKITKTEDGPKHLKFAVLAADTVLFTIRGGELCVRLIPVHRPPYFRNTAGLPGGLLFPKESAEQAAFRHLTTKAGIQKEHIYAEQLYTFSAVHRDPRGRVVAVVYMALAPWEHLSPAEQHNTETSWWCPITKIPKLAYDHDEVLALAIQRLRARITYTTIVGKILPREFTLTDLEHAYETILKKNIDKRNFRKKILKLKLLAPVGRERRGLKWRPAKLYSFRSAKVVPIEIL